MKSSNVNHRIKEFKWTPNPAADSEEIYVFLNVPVIYFNFMTCPGDNLTRLDEVEIYLNDNNEVWMPIIGHRTADDGDCGNSIFFQQGRHTTCVAEAFSDANSKITVMAPFRFYQNIIKDLRCEISKLHSIGFDAYETKYFYLTPVKTIN